MAQRHIQFYRNGTVYENRTAALAQVNAFKENNLPSMKDGEIVLFRYMSPTETNTGATGAIIGYTFSKNNITDMYTIDIADLNFDKIEERFENIEEIIDGISFVKSVSQVLKDNESYSTEETDLYSVKSTDATGGTETEETYQLMFTPISPLELTVPQDIGEIKRGTTASQLSQKSLSTILDEIIFKTINPTLTAPQFTVSWTGYNGSIIHEYGETAPTTDNVKETFVAGSYIIDDGIHGTETAYTSNEVTYSYSGFDESTFETLGTKTYTITATYSASSEEIKDSKGQKATVDSDGNVIPSNPDTGGTLTDTLTIEVSLPLYIRRFSESQGTGKQALKPWETMVYEFEMVTGTMTGDTALVIESPKELSSIKIFNTLSGNYDIDWLDNFEETEETINNYTYHVYTWNGAAAGAENIQITTV